MISTPRESGIVEKFLLTSAFYLGVHVTDLVRNSAGLHVMAGATMRFPADWDPKHRSLQGRGICHA